jgi:hypothetical protein
MRRGARANKALAVVCGIFAFIRGVAYLSLPWHTERVDFDVLGVLLVFWNFPKLAALATFWMSLVGVAVSSVAAILSD